MARALELEPREPEKPEVACPYCDEAALFLSSSAALYGGRDYGPVWACLPCHAWVGVHKDTRTPYGRLADGNLRRMRQDAHRYFDHLWHRKLGELSPDRKRNVVLKQVRGDAYRWLASNMNLTNDECHIGMFDEDQCREVVRLCQPYYRPEKLVPWVRQWSAKCGGKSGAAKV
jgi:hypothetical protein